MLDSFALVDFLAVLEEHTGIKVPDSDVNPSNFQTIEADRALRRVAQRSERVNAFVRGSGVACPSAPSRTRRLRRNSGSTPSGFTRRRGIRSRRWAAPGETAGSLAARALRAALEDASLEPGEVDYLLFGTMTPDRFIPGSAYSVQRELGLGEIPCLDIRATCCNALYGLQLARALVTSGAARNVAVCLAEVQSPWLRAHARGRDDLDAVRRRRFGARCFG